MINKGLPYIPPMREVVAAADLFDQMGDFESAALLDEYIEQTAESDGDIVKLAGFWANVWKRMKGRAKMWFYSEYKELYNAAREAQEEIQKRIDEAEKAVHELKKDVKNHDLQDWRLKLDEMKILNTKDITASFDKIYGRFLSYIMKFKDQQEKEEKTGPLTPSEKVERMTKGPSEGAPGGREVKWVPQDKDRKIFLSRNGDMARIDKDAIQYIKTMKPVRGKPEYRKVWEKTGLKVMKNTFGDSMWMEIYEDDKYVYYREVVVPAGESKTTTEEKPETPKKPEGLKGKDFPAVPLPPMPTGPKREPEPATDILTDEEEELEKELAEKEPEPLKEEKPAELSKEEKPATTPPKAEPEKPAVSKKKQGAQKVWTEVIGGTQLKKVKIENPAARLFTYMQRKSLSKNHRELNPKDENDVKIIAYLEMQGPAAKAINRYIPLVFETKEKTASSRWRQSRIDRLISLMLE
jgi:hypothetical protein